MSPTMLGLGMGMGNPLTTMGARMPFGGAGFGSQFGSGFGPPGFQPAFGPPAIGAGSALVNMIPGGFGNFDIQDMGGMLNPKMSMIMMMTMMGQGMTNTMVTNGMLPICPANIMFMNNFCLPEPGFGGIACPANMLLTNNVCVPNVLGVNNGYGGSSNNVAYPTNGMTNSYSNNQAYQNSISNGMNTGASTGSVIFGLNFNSVLGSTCSKHIQCGYGGTCSSNVCQCGMGYQPMHGGCFKSLLDNDVCLTVH